MSGLVAYGSSDEEEESDKLQKAPLESAADTKTSKSLGTRSKNGDGEKSGPKSTDRSIEQTTSEVPLDVVSREDAPLLGPALGPAQMPGDEQITYPDEDGSEEAAAGEPPQSPYSANRAMLRTLTLPPIQNRDIPPSPPGSPPASTNKKFAHFLDLKKQGVHFNEKLAKSSALRNPGLMQKLMDFADIDETQQYETTLPTELWNPTNFPKWAYKEELAKKQQQILKKKEEEKSKTQRDSVDFVPAAAAPGESSRGVTPSVSGSGRVPAKSAAERIMAGLDRGRSGSPQVQVGMKRKTRFDS